MSNEADVDPEVEELLAPTAATNIAVIRTSDRISFKRCRRRWGWSSHLKQNLGTKQVIDPLWFGTGVHYALEDFHGYNKYGSAREAFKAYCSACKADRQHQTLPTSFDELRELGIGMLTYYQDEWLQDRDPLKTLWVEGVPQVELRVLLRLPFNPKEYYPDSPYTDAYYSLTIDRVVEDVDNALWLLDYKTAKAFQTLHYQIDPQVGAYYWAGNHLYPGRKIAGFYYQQHRKDSPNEPRITSMGRLSTDARQLITHRAYRKQLVNIFGADLLRWPNENLKFLNDLALLETPEGDKFIKRDKIYRNEYNFESEGTKILLEVEDMLNPNLPLYPNPTRDCAFMCPFYHACCSMDDGSDWVSELEMSFALRPKEQDSWRDFLPTP